VRLIPNQVIVLKTYFVRPVSVFAVAGCLGACSGEEPAPHTSATGGGHPSPGSGGIAASSGGASITSGSGGVPGGAGMSSGAGGGAGSGTVTAGSAGALATAGAGAVSGGAGADPGIGGIGGAGAPAAGSPGASGGGQTGGGGFPSEIHTRDHCVEGYEPDPSDATITDGPAEFTQNNQIDLTVHPKVIEWMQAHKWEPAHFEWHSIRRCNGGGSMSKINVCSHTEMIPSDQECKSTGDGLQFLTMHRHMIQSLKQLWPNHQEQFTGFAHFPQSANDVPEQWRADWNKSPPFSATDIANAKIADEIDKHLDMFPTEGDFGRWLQCLSPTYSGLHGALHFAWVRTQNDTHGLGNQFTNIDNYMFWKLHGWIDNVWEKYRVAKGMAPDDMKLVDQLKAQCYEMDKLATLIDPSVTGPDNATLPEESGVFHTQVRPMFESSTTKCSGCHGPQGAEAGMTLGGHVSSADIVKNLVNRPTTTGGQFIRVVPGDPEHSWVYLKAAALAASAGCTETSAAQCKTGQMPPTESVRPTSEELQNLYDWIKSGAPAPTSP
jgi:hypothetical protein